MSCRNRCRDSVRQKPISRSWPSAGSTIFSPMPAPISRYEDCVEDDAQARAYRAKARRSPLIATHENVVAISMAHGYANISGKVPAVMVHVSASAPPTRCAANVQRGATEGMPIAFYLPGALRR